MLHERRGGWADAMQTVRHLAEPLARRGAEIREDVEVTGFELGEDGSRAVLTSAGRVACETVVAARGRGWSRCGLLGWPPRRAGR